MGDFLAITVIDNWRTGRIYKERLFSHIEGENRESSPKQMKRMGHSIETEPVIVRSCHNCLFFRSCSAARKELCKVSPDRTHGNYVEWRSRR
jgi:hypothetical protein